jgi:hypothetical protein
MLRQAPAAPKQLEAGLAYPLQWQQMGSVLQYVYADLRGDPLDADARWNSERTISEINQALAAYSSGSPLDVLREALSQYLDASDLPNADAAELQGKLSALRTTQRQIPQGKREKITRNEPIAALFKTEQITIGERQYELRIAPVQTLPNLNLLDDEAMELYFEYLGLPEKTAEELSWQLIDFRDTDNIPRANNAEAKILIDDRFYAEPRNAPIRDWSDLALWPGMDAAMLDFLRAHFRLDGDDGRVYLAGADPGMLGALADLHPEQVKMALEYEAKKNDLNYNQTLEQVLGGNAAKRWRNYTADNVSQDAPMTLSVIAAQGGETLRAIYFPTTRVLRRIYME